MSMAFDIRLEDITQSGWAIVFHQDENQAVKEALAPLIEHRRNRIGDDNIVKVLEYREGDQAIPWLARHRLKFGLVEPGKIPYYILIVGSPSQIPFAFSQALDIVYAVGRLHFDAVDGYQRYVESVLEYERAVSVPNGKEIVFWGPRNKNDVPTKLSSERLIEPLALGAKGEKSAVERAAKFSKVDYTGRLFDPDNSTKENLTSVFRPMTGESAPCMLFTASHGVGWPNGHERQRSAQGALVCQNFPGVGLGSLRRDFYFAASDLPQDARLHGLICFHFASFSAGTPEVDIFSPFPGEPPQSLAPSPFLSALPQALLSHPNGGALGVLGYIGRAWGNSSFPTSPSAFLPPFQNAIGFILDGQPLGWAAKEFTDVFSASSVNLTNAIRDKSAGAEISDRAIVDLWIERTGSQGLMLLGDPAVCVRKNNLQ